MKGFDPAMALEIFGDLLPKIGREVLEIREEDRLSPTIHRSAANMKELVTAADLAAESALVGCVQKHWPHHGIRGEEGTDIHSSSGHEWIFDPIDGTNRFAVGMDMFAVSAGLTLNGVPEFGVLYFPANGIFANASRDRGAFFNRERIVVPSGGRLQDEIFVGFSVRNPKAEEEIHKLGCHIMEIHSVSGSTLLVIRGMMGVYVHKGATPFDLGATALIAKEAGCAVSQFDGQPIDFSKSHIPVIIARNVEVLEEMKRICAS